MSDTLIPLVEEAGGVEKEFSTDYAKVREQPLPSAVEELRLAYLGRKGKITGLLEGLRSCPKEHKPVAGKTINQLKKSAESAIEELKVEAGKWLLQQKLKGEPVDISLPVASERGHGSLHPVTLMRRVLSKEFRRLGFTVYDGPEVEFDFFNFTALNMPEHHPARDMQDTFYVDSEDDLVLRTHTSNIQIHAMLAESPPLRVVALGRVYRCDSDATHTPMFHQIEGFVVDKDISFAHLKATIDTFLKAVYGDTIATRFRPSFFPFVEPGAEMDMPCVSCAGKGCRVCKDTGWIELGGCGMIHPNVFEAVGYDSEIYTGFAFGFGLDRMAMQKYGLNDLRLMFEGDDGFLRQFPCYP